jgi:DNA-binding MarR family transcriptional regulator
MPHPPVPDLSTHLGYWLRFVSNHVSHGFMRKLDGLGVTAAEWVILREMYDESDIAPSRLAEKIGMTRGAVTKLADRLVAKELAARRADPSDKRAQTLALTAKGRELVPELAALADRNDAEYFGHLSAQERSLVEGVLRDIVARHGLKTLPVS